MPRRLRFVLAAAVAALLVGELPAGQALTVDIGRTTSPATTAPVVSFVATSPIDGIELTAGALARASTPPGTHSFGVRWAGDATELRVRTHGPDGWSSWMDLEDEPDHGEDRRDLAPDSTDTHLAGPIWAGHDTDLIEIGASSGSLDDLVVLADDTQLTEVVADVVADAVTVAPRAPGASGFSGAAGRIRPRPNVRANRQWGSPGWNWRACPGGPEASRPVDLVLVHHTATTNSYGPDDVDDILRSIHRFHTGTRGWCDIAYQFLVDRFGRIWEGRSGGISVPMIGGHAQGFNTASTGIAVIGDHSAASMGDATASSVALLASWKAASNDFAADSTVVRTSRGSPSIPAGRSVRLPRISGHRDVSTSACPGSAAYVRLPSVRATARNFFPPVSRVRFGSASATPLVGNWDGRGAPGVGTFDGTTFVLHEKLGDGGPETVIAFGLPGDRAVVGDWDGDGSDTVGVERDGQFLLLDSNARPLGLPVLVADRTIDPNVPADFDVARAVPIVGDWDGDGIDTLGYVAGNDIVQFADPAASRVLRRFRTGRVDDGHLVGDWNGDGVAEINLVRGGSILVPMAGSPSGYIATHRLAPGVTPFIIDLTGRSLPTLLTVTADRVWDPTTPVGV